MSTTIELPSQPPWLSWLAHGVLFVTDEQGRVCALRSFNGGAPAVCAPAP